MRKTQAAFISVALAILHPSTVYSRSETSLHKVRGSGCVNLRAKPSMDAAVVNCLPSGSDVAVSRIPPSGRFVWVNDQAGRTWYKASVPGTNAVGWIIPACTNIFEETKTESCTDYGSAAQNSGTQTQNSNSTSSLAQNTRKEEVLRNPNWQVVPGAQVGRNPVDTSIDVNNIAKQGEVVTFDITGYQGMYYRLQGNCSTRQVRLLRRGLLGVRDIVNYELVGDGEKVFDFHRKLLNFACKQSNTQIASSPTEASTPETSPPPENNQSNQVGTNGISDTFLSGKKNCKFEPIPASEGEVAVKVETTKFQENIGHSIKVTHTVKKLRGSYDEASGDRSLDISGCLTGVRIVNLDFDSEEFGGEYHEVILDFQTFDGRAGMIIFDGCGGCHSTWPTKVPLIRLLGRSGNGYYLEDLDKDGALEIITDSLPVEVYQFRAAQTRRSNHDLQVNDVTDQFSLWYAEETKRRLDRDYSGWTAQLPDCPCNAGEAARRPARFIESNYIERKGIPNPLKPEPLIAGERYYHPGAVRLFRQAYSLPYTSPTGKKLKLQPGQQCTYDARGQLITDGEGAGTPDAFSPVSTSTLPTTTLNIPRPGIDNDIPARFIPYSPDLHIPVDTNTFKAFKNHLGKEGVERYQKTWIPNKGRDEKGDVCPANKVP